jgi:hypothetical protein
VTQKERADELLDLLRQVRELSEENERLRAEASTMPGSVIGELLIAKNVEIATLKSQVRQLQSQQDDHASYRVFLVPGARHLEACKALLAKDPKLDIGDRLRDADSLREFAWNGRNWTAV